ncbi:MAG: D-glycero-alpha-D-manno-heptose-1,7-bisphosphate 7-phosphatase [Pyrinomonadaceae bacterium]
MNDQRAKRPAAFIDRDGTLIEEVNFLSRVDDLRIFPFTGDAIRRLKDNGYLIIVVTNQSGIGRSIYDRAAMQSIHDEMQRKLDNAIDAFFHCPHLPDEGCRCRKPGLGMIEAAAEQFGIDMSRSWMIGDKKLDAQTGFNAGIRTAMVRTGYGRSHESELERLPDVIADDLLAAVVQMLQLENIVIGNTF